MNDSTSIIFLASDMQFLLSVLQAAHIVRATSKGKGHPSRPQDTQWLQGRGTKSPNGLEEGLPTPGLVLVSGLLVAQLHSRMRAAGEQAQFHLPIPITSITI